MPDDRDADHAVPVQDRQATWVATAVDEWVRCGLRRVMVAPGSRSTPLAIAFAERPELHVEVFIDERSAAFAALGAAMVDGVPCAVVCTSGTAATHFHAAVVEADLSCVPLLVLTADRPIELHGIGAPQTIEQVGLYGAAVRAAAAVCPGRTPLGRARRWARRCWQSMIGHHAGPVHANVELLEPLLGAAGALPPGDDDDLAGIDDLDPGVVPTRRATASIVVPGEATGEATGDAPTAAIGWAGVCGARRGVIVAGHGVSDPAAVEALAARLGWPVFADPRSRCRSVAGAVCAFDPLLRTPRWSAERVEVYIQLGMPPASKVLGQWLTGQTDLTGVAVSPHAHVVDPWSVGARQVTAPIDGWCRALTEALPVAADRSWREGWLAAEHAAQHALDEALAGPTLSEPGVARVLSTVPPSNVLVVSSSMPIRDLEWFGAPGDGPLVLANRGANGIDGVLATAIGAATHGRPTVALLGDLALCHDLSSLAALARRDLDLCVVVIDNRGGGIFSFLPQAEALPAGRFEQLFGTPSGLDLAAVLAAADLPVTEAATLAELDSACRGSGGGARFVVVRTDRAENVVVHRRLAAAVSSAMG